MLVRKRISRGHVLGRQLVQPYAADYEALFAAGDSSSSASSASNARRSANLLSFGYETARGMAAAEGRFARHDSGTAVCALVNLGVSLFDHQLDKARDGGARLLQIFDDDVLRRLVSDPGDAETLQEEALRERSPHLRLLLQTIAEIFKRLHEGKGQSTDDRHDAWRQVVGWIYASFEAQLSTQTRASGKQIEHKSLGPFNIMFAVMDFLEPSSQAAKNIPCPFRVHFPRAIWLIDDIVDLEEDFMQGSPNAVLQDATRSQKDLAEIVAAATADTVTSVTAFSSALIRSGDALGVGVERTLLSYVRSWLT